MAVTEAIILAGGLGTRLRSAVPDLPKCMAPVDGKPFIAFLLAWLKKEGIERFIFSLGYKSEVIIDYLEKDHADLEKVYAIEEEPLGTGGAIRLAAQVANTASVLVVNGDTLFNVDVPWLSDAHQDAEAECTLALKEMKNFSRYGTVELDKNNRITSFKEKQYQESGYINGGVYVIEVKKFLAHDLPQKFSFEKDYLEANVGKINLAGEVMDYFFIDIGIPEDYKTFQDYYHMVLNKSKYEPAKSSMIALDPEWLDIFDI